MQRTVSEFHMVSKLLNLQFMFSVQPSFFAVKIGVFYVIYYAFLSAYFVAMMLIFYQTLDDNEPKWKGPERGIIGENPGLSVTQSLPRDGEGGGGRDADP